MRVNLVGQRFGRWLVTAFAGTKSDRHLLWLCRCDCGTEKAVTGHYLKNGDSRSCGCLKKEQIGSKHPRFKHGATVNDNQTPEYTAWCAMIQRCMDPNRVGWMHYGRAGVKVCDRWLDPEHGFKNFLADMGPRPAGTTNGRFGDVGNYEPGNCRWMTPKEQADERRKKGIAFFTPEALIQGARASLHNRWHLNRNLVSENCPLCQALVEKRAAPLQNAPEDFGPLFQTAEAA